MKTTTGNVLFALGGLTFGVVVGVCSREIAEKFKRKLEEPTKKKVLVVNVVTKALSVVVLEPGEKVEDNTLKVIDVLNGSFVENNKLQSLRSNRNMAKIKEANLEVSKIANIWFSIKKQIDTITPEQIAQMVLEACENTGEGK